MRKILSLLLLYFLSNNSFAQPQWKFHIAFEDATGAKDTLWCIWDSSAHGTLPTDTAFGEGTVIFDHSVFNVWIYNYDGDSTKTGVVPFAWGFGLEVRAFNYQYPLIISWDSSLFNLVFPWPYSSIDQARIDNDYFFFENNQWLFQAFNMLLDNHALAPSFNWFSQNHFPMYFSIARNDTLYVKVDEIQSSILKLFPNPTGNNVTIFSSDKIKKIDVFSEDGVKAFSKRFSQIEFTNEYNLSLESLQPGFYLINILNFKNQIYHEKILKIP